MSKRGLMLVCGALGVIWAVAVVFWIPSLATIPFMPLPTVFMVVSFLLGLPLIAMIGTIAARRFLGKTGIDGVAYPDGSAGDIDRRVLVNTTEQALLALLIWPLVGLSLGGVTIVVMGVSFVFARLAFWIGYRVSPPLRTLGFAATFYPTALAAVWVVLRWLL